MAARKKPIVLINETSQASATTSQAIQPDGQGGFFVFATSTVGGTLLIQRRRQADETTWDELHSETLSANTPVKLIFEFSPGLIRARFTPDSSADFVVELTDHT